MYVDFELAIHTAAKLVFPSVKTRSCQFHLGQNWWKKIQNLHLVAEFKAISEKRSVGLQRRIAQQITAIFSR
ncbi:hypothetical protein ANN_13979 [Periplaneta americana]|uniref:MULE transposase domain-containing protein n=1 Tax=Periplaneta americana TaxID=6978 RepID=A0ABQ8SV19_PERAM|nr:hypothetical protein ANN_13979 [Periplaneta americana]